MLVKHEDELPYSRCGPALLSRRDNSSKTSFDFSKLALVRLQTELWHIGRTCRITAAQMWKIFVCGPAIPQRLPNELWSVQMLPAVCVSE